MQTSHPVTPSGPSPDAVAAAPRSDELTSRTRRPALALCGFTLFTWITRVPLAWGDDELTAAGKVAAMVPVLVFVVLGLVTGVALLRRRPVASGLVLGLGVWTIGYWLVRAPLIAAGDHPAGFIVVHSILGLVAAGLAVASLTGLAADGALPGRARRATA